MSEAFPSLPYSLVAHGTNPSSCVGPTIFYHYVTFRNRKTLRKVTNRFDTNIASLLASHTWEEPISILSTLTAVLPCNCPHAYLSRNTEHYIRLCSLG